MDWLNFFKIAGYTAIIFGAVCTVTVGVLKDKRDKAKEDRKQEQMDTLSTDVKASRQLLEPFTELAKKMYPGLDQKDALEKLKGRMDSVDAQIKSGKENVDHLHSQLDVERKTIKTFTATMSVEFSGQWTQIPYAIWHDPPTPDTLLSWMDSSGELPELEFTTSRVSCETVDDHTGRFTNSLTIQPGNYPLGELWDVLKKYDQAQLRLLFTFPERFTGPVLTVTRVDIDFYINGAKKGGLHNSQPITQDFSETFRQAVPGKAWYLTPRLDLVGKPVDIFQFSL